MRIEDVSILICDDSILARKQLKDVISTLGTPTFYESADGVDAVQKYKEFKPDIVFMDIVMPKQDGIETVQNIMNFDPDAEIIIVSSIGTMTQLKAAIELGAKDFIQKPLNENQVITLLDKYLEGR